MRLSSALSTSFSCSISAWNTSSVLHRKLDTWGFPLVTHKDYCRLFKKQKHSIDPSSAFIWGIRPGLPPHLFDSKKCWVTDFSFFFFFFLLTSTWTCGPTASRSGWCPPGRWWFHRSAACPSVFLLSESWCPPGCPERPASSPGNAASSRQRTRLDNTTRRVKKNTSRFKET